MKHLLSKEKYHFRIYLFFGVMVICCRIKYLVLGLNLQWVRGVGPGVTLGEWNLGRYQIYQIAKGICWNSKEWNSCPNRTSTTWNLLSPCVVNGIAVNSFKSKLRNNIDNKMDVIHSYDELTVRSMILLIALSLAPERCHSRGESSGRWRFINQIEQFVYRQFTRWIQVTITLFSYSTCQSWDPGAPNRLKIDQWKSMNNLFQKILPMLIMRIYIQMEIKVRFKIYIK